MSRQLRPRFWVEVASAAASAAVLLATLVWGQWVELVFRVDADHGNGSVEWLVVMASVTVTAVLLAGAGREWRRAALRLASLGVAHPGS